MLVARVSGILFVGLSVAVGCLLLRDAPVASPARDVVPSPAHDELLTASPARENIRFSPRGSRFLLAPGNIPLVEGSHPEVKFPGSGSAPVEDSASALLASRTIGTDINFSPGQSSAEGRGQARLFESFGGGPLSNTIYLGHSSAGGANGSATAADPAMRSGSPGKHEVAPLPPTGGEVVDPTLLLSLTLTQPDTNASNSNHETTLSGPKSFRPMEGVPEPSTILLLGTALAAAVCARRQAEKGNESRY
jgi:hypothetical protein